MSLLTTPLQLAQRLPLYVITDIDAFSWPSASPSSSCCFDCGLSSTLHAFFPIQQRMKLLLIVNSPRVNQWDRQTGPITSLITRTVRATFPLMTTTDAPREEVQKIAQNCSMFSQRLAHRNTPGVGFCKQDIGSFLYTFYLNSTFIWWTIYIWNTSLNSPNILSFKRIYQCSNASSGITVYQRRPKMIKRVPETCTAFMFSLFWSNTCIWLCKSLT